MTSGSNVTQQSIQVSTASGSSQDVEPISFTVTATTKSGGNWLSVSPNNGTTPATLTVSIDSGGLQIGPYTGTITVTPTAGASQIVSVTLNVTNPQTLSATPTLLAFTYTPGAPTPAAQSVTVNAGAGPAVSVSAIVATTDKGNWLLVNPISGTTPLELSVSVNPSRLATNTYRGTITISAGDQSVTPIVIPVTLTVNPAGPTITSIVNAASFATGSVAPGEIVTIFGSGLGPETGVPWTASGTDWQNPGRHTGLLRQPLGADPVHLGRASFRDRSLSTGHGQLHEADRVVSGNRIAGRRSERD